MWIKSSMSFYYEIKAYTSINLHTKTTKTHVFNLIKRSMNIKI